MATLALHIQGMSCGHCVARVEKALGKLAGVAVDNVEIGSASLRYDPARIGAERIREAVEDLGYTADLLEAAA